MGGPTRAAAATHLPSAGRAGGAIPRAAPPPPPPAAHPQARPHPKPIRPLNPPSPSTEFDGYDEDETVRVVLTGNQVPKSVEITKEGVDAGAEVRGAEGPRRGRAGERSRLD
jgi:hypothetical protein